MKPKKLENYRETLHGSLLKVQEKSHAEPMSSIEKQINHLKQLSTEVSKGVLKAGESSRDSPLSRRLAAGMPNNKDAQRMRATHAGTFGGRLDDLTGSRELPTITPSSPNHQLNSQRQDGSYPGYLASPPTFTEMTPLTQCLLGHAGGAAAGREDGRPESGARAVVSAGRRESGIETADASQDSDHGDKQLNIEVVDIKSASHHVSINRKRRESQSLFLKAKKMPSDKFECIPIKVWNGLAMDGVKVQ